MSTQKKVSDPFNSPKPIIFHSDQGSQYTCTDFIAELKKRKIRVSMSGRGRCFDNILAERLWRTVKY
ncbi:MAG: transposase family protein, partial [Sedimentisphaerales bacterium]|nr:transposase family protein [Sedimentisphaerales bacterium]